MGVPVVKVTSLNTVGDIGHPKDGYSRRVTLLLRLVLFPSCYLSFDRHSFRPRLQSTHSIIYMATSSSTADSAEPTDAKYKANSNSVLKELNNPELTCLRCAGAVERPYQGRSCECVQNARRCVLHLSECRESRT